MYILRSGGNAFDAAIGAALAEGVLNPHMHTFGGELSALVFEAQNKKVFSINGNTVAPKAASIDWFHKNGYDLIPGAGLLAAGPCAAPGAFLAVLEQFGTWSFSKVVEPALSLAEDGFPMHAALRGPAPSYLSLDFSISGNAEHFLKKWPSTAKVYLPDGKLPEVGQILKNQDLAHTFRRLIRAEERKKGGRVAGLRAVWEEFYEGDIARIITSHAKEHGGLLDASDMADFRVDIEDAISLTYQGYDVHKCGAWSQGPVFLQQLAMLEGFDLKAMGHNSADYIHTLIEVAKLAFADREQYYGDPRFTDVPLTQLLDRDYARVRRNLIDPRQASLVQQPGDPRKGKALLERQEVLAARNWGPGTVYVTVVDTERNMASFTPSGAWIPSSPVVEGLGFPLGTRVQTFFLDEGHPNALVPGKRPRTTLTPTLVTRDGEANQVFGTPGGDQQDQWTLQYFLAVVEFGLDVQSAIEAPRFSTAHFPTSFYPHSRQTGLVRVEDRVPKSVLGVLEERGHLLQVNPGWTEGDVLGIRVDRTHGTLQGGADLRGEKSKRMPSHIIAW